MRARRTFAIAVTMLSVFAVVAAASAQGLVTLTAKPTLLSYPHSAKLTVGFPDSAPATAVILAMPIGSSVWTTTTLSATTSSPVVTVKPKVITAYKAWIGEGLVSEPTTVSVAAKLSMPQINGNLRKGRSYVVKGTMQPAEAGTVTVTYWRMETVLQRQGKGHVKKVSTWVVHHTDLAGLKALNSTTSKWATKWAPVEKGWWKIVVSHADLTHARSSAATFKWVR